MGGSGQLLGLVGSCPNTQWSAAVVLPTPSSLCASPEYTRAISFQKDSGERMREPGKKLVAGQVGGVDDS